MGTSVRNMPQIRTFHCYEALCKHVPSFKSTHQYVSLLLGSRNTALCRTKDSNNQGLHCVRVVATLKFISNIEMEEKKKRM